MSAPADVPFWRMCLAGRFLVLNWDGWREPCARAGVQEVNVNSFELLVCSSHGAQLDTIVQAGPCDSG